MKTLFISLLSIFAITAIITHIWTVIIAFSSAGFWGAFVTLLLPFLSEVYWMLKMFGENDIYAFIALIYLILCILYGIISTK